MNIKDIWIYVSEVNIYVNLHWMIRYRIWGIDITEQFLKREIAASNGNILIEKPDVPNECIFGVDNEFKTVSRYIELYTHNMFRYYEDYEQKREKCVEVTTDFDDEILKLSKRMKLLGITDSSFYTDGVSMIQSKTKFIDKIEKNTVYYKNNLRASLKPTIKDGYTIDVTDFDFIDLSCFDYKNVYLTASKPVLLRYIRGNINLNMIETRKIHLDKNVSCEQADNVILTPENITHFNRIADCLILSSDGVYDMSNIKYIHLHGINIWGNDPGKMIFNFNDKDEDMASKGIISNNNSKKAVVEIMYTRKEH